MAWDLTLLRLLNHGPLHPAMDGLMAMVSLITPPAAMLAVVPALPGRRRERLLRALAKEASPSFFPNRSADLGDL